MQGLQFPACVIIVFFRDIHILPHLAQVSHTIPLLPLFSDRTRSTDTLTMHLPHIKPTATYQTTAWRPFRSKFRPFAFQASGKREQNVISRQICKRKKKKRVKWRHTAANQFNPSCRVLSVLSNGPSVRGGTWIGARGPDLVSLFFIFLSYPRDEREATPERCKRVKLRLHRWLCDRIYN